MSTQATPSRRTGQPRLVLVAGAAIALFLVFAPAKALHGERSRISRLETRLAAVTAANEELHAEAQRLRDAEQLELLIRERLGWVKPGERAYLVVEEPPAPAPPAAGAPDGPSWWSRLLQSGRAIVFGRG